MRKKSNPTFIIVFILIAIALIIANTYARYNKQVAGNGSAYVAKWSFNADGFGISRTDYVSSSQILQGQLAPGTSGTINVDIDVTGCDVAVDYMIVLHTFTGKPTHLVIYNEAGEELEYDSVNNRYTVEGSILVTEQDGLKDEHDNVIKHVQLPFEWPYETVPTAGVEQSELDAIDTNEGQTIEEMSFYITVIGMQQAQSNKAVWNISTTGLGTPQVTTVELADKTNGVIEVVVDATGITSGINYTITLSEIQNGLDIMTFTDEDGHALTKNGNDYVLEGTATQEEIQANPIITRYIHYTGTNSNQGKLDSYKGARIQLAGNGSNETKTIRGITTLADADAPMLIDVEILAEEKSEEGLNEAGTIYTIKTAKGLSDFRDSVNAGNNYAGITVTQVADIDMNSVCSASLGSWTPIGATGTSFAGTYDGGFHKISNLYIKSSDYLDIGLFTKLTSSAIVENLIMNQIYIENNCMSTSKRETTAGGIVGYCNGTVRNCGIESGNVKVIKSSNNYSSGISASGGITGYVGTDVRIDKCYNKAEIYAEVPNQYSAHAMAAGISGYNTGLSGNTISNCYNAGTIKTKYAAYSWVGGIVGELYGSSNITISNCYNVGTLDPISYATLFRGEIVARIQSCGTISIQKSYCLNNYNNYGTQVSSQVLKTYATDQYLGNAFENDTNNSNNGYPILTWQSNIVADLYADASEGKAVIEIIHSKNSIVRVENENGVALTKISDTLYKEIATTGNHTYTITDTAGNEKSYNLKIKVINSATDLNNFRDSVNAGNNYAGTEVIQTANIDMSGVCSANLGSWTPIGVGTSFAGTYDGGYHTISNLYINSNQYFELGMFTKTAKSSVIKRLVLSNVYIQSTYNSETTTDSNGEYYASCGGITGYGLGKIEQCGIESGNIRIANEFRYFSTWKGGMLGGIAGKNEGTINKCYNKAEINNQTKNENYNAAMTGGITGSAITGSVITNSYNTGNVSSSSYYTVNGGIIGDKWQYSISISNCYNIGDIASGTASGGIIGRNQGGTLTITKCYCLASDTYGATRVTSTVLKTYASTLGAAYLSDTNNINNGYPILAWQEE